MIGTGCPLILAFPPGHEYAGATDHGHAEDREAVGDIAPKYEAPNGRENHIGVIEGREPTGYLDDDTVRSWLKRCRAGGLDEMTLFDWHGRPGHLSLAQEAELTLHLGERLYRDSGEVAAHIEAAYAVDYSHSGCIKLMHRLGFEYKRLESLPAQADEAKQGEFIEAYDKLLNGLADDEAVYFVDAVHPEYQSRPAHGWIKKGDKVALRRTSGRKRINLHGALNLENFHCPLVQAERINAASTIALFEKLEADNPGKRRIHVFADNARYHHAVLVREWLARRWIHRSSATPQLM